MDLENIRVTIHIFENWSKRDKEREQELKVKEEL